MTLSEKILALRKDRGYSQEELAEQLRVSRQAVSCWETGSAQPDASNVLQLSKLFGVSTDYLLNDDYERDTLTGRSGEDAADRRERLQKIIGLVIAGIGLLGNFVIFVLSRLIPVMLPQVVYENGEKMYQYNRNFIGYSYFEFLDRHNLDFLVKLFWCLLAAGVICYLVSGAQKPMVSQQKDPP